MARYRILVALLLLLWAGLFFALERVLPSSRWVWAEGAGAAALAWYLYLVFEGRRDALLSSGFQIFYWLGLLASAFAISTGATMVEIEREGNANGTFWLVLGFFVACMECALAGYRSGGVSIRELKVVTLPKVLQNLTLFAAIAPVLVLSAYTVIRFGGPVLMGISRTEFWHGLAPASIKFLPNLTNQTYFFAAYYFLHRRLQGNLVATSLGLTVVLSYVAVTVFVLGEKYSAFIVYANAWLFVFAALYPNFRVKPSQLLFIGFLCASLISLVAYSYVASGASVSFIFTRVALQAQLLWSVLDDGSALNAFPQQWWCFWDCAGMEGTQYISERYLPAHRFAHYQNVGSRLSGFMPALTLLTFGWLTTVSVFAAFSFALGWLQRKAVIALRSDNLIYGFLLFKLQFGLSSLLATGLLVTFRGIAAMIVALACYLMLSAFTRARGAAK